MIQLIAQILAQIQIQINPQPPVNPNSIDIKTIGILFTIITTIWGVIWWYRKQLRSSKFSIDTTPFEVLPPKSDILAVVFPGNKKNPLADAAIKYQQRLSDRDIKQELINKLESQDWVLILGRTGLGKTREAAEVTQVFNNEDWTVLYLKDWEWLDLPTRKQLKELNQTRKILFFLDDLNRKMAFGLKDKSPQAEELPLAPLTKPLQIRLLETITEYQENFDYIKVIATARNEKQPENNTRISEWEKLDWDKYPNFWEKFTIYNLPTPEDNAVVHLLQDTIPKTGITANETDYITIAKRNDRTFRNVVENLTRIKNRGLDFTVENYRDTLRQNWDEHYQNAINKYPLSKYIYDAIDLLLQIGIPLAKTTVLPTTKLLMEVPKWQFWHKKNINKALAYLTEVENIYQPRDGQIEAKGSTIEINSSYILDLYNIFIFYFQKSRELKQKISFLSPLLFYLYEYKHYHQIISLCDYEINYFGYNSELLCFLWGTKGIALRNLARFEEAIESYDKALKFNPDKDSAWYMRGIALGHLARFEEAIESYDKALKFNPDKDSAWYMRGIALGNLARFEEAIESYDKALEIKPDDDSAWNNRGIALGNLARFEEAIESYDKALEIKPDDDSAWNNRGNALGNLARFEEAIESYDKALEINPDDDSAWYMRGNALDDLGRFDDAIDSYDKALEINPDDDSAWMIRGIALGKLGRFEEAIESYDKALKFNPDKDSAWYMRGIALDNLARFEEAIESYDKALKFNPDDDSAWYMRGNALDDLGRFEEAIESYDKALKFNPDDDSAWYMRGNALDDLGRFDDAIASYDKALEINPDDDSAWMIRGIALGKLGRYSDEIASFDKALEINPDKDSAWMIRGIALGNLGRYSDEIASFDKALEINPDDDSAWMIRGIALGKLGRFEEAIDSYDKALEIKPDDDSAWYNRGNALGKLGRFDDAIDSYDKALEINPDDDSAWYMRGIALGNLARFEEAIESYDKALEIKPDDDSAWNNRGNALGN
ncbi:MAG: tetratricopeptide repeat protein, partial [Xenococcaceae cyanobacterium MO_167.B27]|nr:tetratricopeptide repeat protein [Xenococcaceae cyanobacterium MO_167.B27]